MRSLPIGDPPAVLAAVAQARAPERVSQLHRLATPLVEGANTTFVYSGSSNRVEVRHFMAHFPSIPPLGQIAPDLWAVTVRLPDQARIEYKLAVHDGSDEELVTDPHNPRSASGSLGTNSVAFGPGYMEPPWAAAGAPEGMVQIRNVESFAFGKDRIVQWYRPKANADVLPLVVVHDGSDFLNHASMASVFDYLIQKREVPPAVMAFIDAEDRFEEYGDDPRHHAFLEEVAATAARRFGADPDPATRVYAGASLGAVAALAAAWRGPEVGALVLFSGAFVTVLGGPTDRGPGFNPVIEFMKRFRTARGKPAKRIYQSCGEYEGLVEDNRSLAADLQRTGAELVYQETRDGHHFHNWRDQMRIAMAHALVGVESATGNTVS